MEDSSKDPETVIHDFQTKLNIKLTQKPDKGDNKIFEYSKGDCRREIRLNTIMNYVILYSYCREDSITVLNFSKEFLSKALYYVAYINEVLDVTCLDANRDNGKFRLKSSQSFPSGMDFGGILEYFWMRHDYEFMLLLENIRELNREIMNQEFKPSELARKFKTELDERSKISI